MKNAKSELINLIVSYSYQQPQQQLANLIYDLTDHIKYYYPMEDQNYQLIPFNETLLGLWQQSLFNSNLKYGQAYLDDLDDLASNDIDIQMLENKRTIEQNGPINWYLEVNDQFIIAKASNLLQIIKSQNSQQAQANAVNWDEVDCTLAMQMAIGIDEF